MKENETLKRFVLFTLTIILFYFLIPDNSSALSAKIEDFYKNKTLKIVCPYSPGGGYDTWARLMALYIPKYTGGNVVVVNKPGASGLVGNNYMYNGVKPDGLTIAVVQPFVILIDEMLGNKGVKYDSTKFRWLGKLSHDEYVGIVNKAHRTLADIKGNPKFKFGLESRTATGPACVVAFCLALGLENAKMVVGYTGSSEIRLAILKGEADGMAGNVSSQLKLIKSGDVNPIAIIGKQRSRDLPGVPTVFELNPKISADDKKWANMIITLTETGRAMLTAPGVPDDKVNFLATIIKKSLHDPGLVSMVEKAGFTINYLSPSELIKNLQTARLNSEEREKFNFLLLRKYPEP